MRAIASAVNLSRHTGVSINAIWFTGWGLQARFRDIFLPITLDCITIKEGTFLDSITKDTPRRKNLWLPKIYQHFAYDKIIRDVNVTPLKKQNFDFDEWARHDRNLMSCYQVFGTFDDYSALIRELFRPAKAVTDKVDAFRQQFSDHTIGLHIRRTDNAESIAASPLHLFIDAVEKEIVAHADTKVFLATDDEATKQELRQHFPGRIITPTVPADRESLAGIIDGLVDMYTLAATRKIYGSQGSSFSPMAAELGNTQLEIMKDPPQPSPREGV